MSKITLHPCNEALASSASDRISDSNKSGGVSRKQLRKLRSQAQKGLKPVGKKFAVVEVFCPPRLTPQVEKIGLRGLDKQQGWNLMDPKLQDWVANEIALHPPELLLMCPPCTDAGGWFHLNKMYMTMAEYRRRKMAFRNYLKFCKRLIKIQLQSHGRFIFEHPAPSEAWRDPEMKAWCDELTSFATDMRRFNLHVPATKVHGKQLNKKSTRLLVSHEDMKPHLCLRCPGERNAHHCEHVKIAGSHPGIGRISTHAGKYTPEFVDAMLSSVPAFRSHEVLLLEGAARDTSPMCEVLVADGQDASDQELNRVLLRLHNNLGHPSPQELTVNPSVETWSSLGSSDHIGGISALSRMRSPEGPIHSESSSNITCHGV